MELRQELEKGIHTGFFDHEGISLEQYRPKLLVNDPKKGQKVLTNLIKELRACDEFFFSVAFITESGVTVLLDVLKELENRNIKGRIIASKYLNFTHPKALKRLMKFSNIDLRIITDRNHHAKGYIFKKKDIYNLIVGSSNLTQDALGYNKEWNLKVASLDRGSIVHETLQEFEETYQAAVPVTESWLHSYETIYIEQKNAEIRKERDVETLPLPYIAADPENPYIVRSKTFQFDRVMPNKMQVRALDGIEAIRNSGEKKSLLVSATGTGKTYLAAFDVKRFDPKRMLFLAHREQLLNQSIESFKHVVGNHIKAGKLTGFYHDHGADYLFSTVQTMSKDDILDKYDKKAFDYIIVDESHRVGAKTYQRILNHFEPEFLLGMTATPERTDEHNICADFDYNIAYEIRLQEAMEENMLCPFHYFGVSEITVDGKLVDDTTAFNQLVSDERLRNIFNKISFYGHQGDKVRGLIFCSSNKEAKALSERFNENGYKTVALSGKDDQEKRELMIERLESDDEFMRLDYIITVDIFNEGVDIPAVNQIVMLRPTQSAIIFVQQLGRGLRRNPGKEYVVILDFIGNYKNNFLIPMALSDDRSYNKDTIRRYTVEGSRVIPGCSTINFDEISRKRIFDAIDEVNFNSIAYMKESYKNLKFRLGRIPMLMDFEIHDSMDLEVLFNASVGSYHEFLVKYEKEYKIRFEDIKKEYIKFISKKLAIGKRPHELLVIKAILEESLLPLADMKYELERKYKIVVEEKTFRNVSNILTNEFPSGTGRNTFKNAIFLDGDQPSEQFLTLLEDKIFTETVKELVEYGLYRNDKYYGERYKNTALSLYKKYSYEDVCRLLEWEKGEVSLNIGGYKYDEKSETYPVFINYHKGDDIADTIRYEDRFESPNRIICISKSGRTKMSNDVQTALKSQELGVRMELFVRKNKDDKTSKEFYYLGSMKPTGYTHEFVMEGTKKNAVEIGYVLDEMVREDIFEYITES